ncbi:GIY-YIG nuclease family protein [Enterovibrio calviensis]|uniref:GIY-YIG nuclease family protein n=1 Tax=Enterovibrio calviensis TaxID=91359 RepID=UPI000483383C|nr:GIY-YIG nuclease family protein [Enterovibrio calviensis]
MTNTDTQTDLEETPPRPQAPWYVYLIRTRENALYCGVTTDVQRRFGEHQENGTKTAKYLRGKQPLTLAWSHEVGAKQKAMSLEWKIKRLAKRDKERLCKESDLILVLFNDRQ